MRSPSGNCSTRIRPIEASPTCAPSTSSWRAANGSKR
jgi:hypothetical protein